MLDSNASMMTEPEILPPLKPREDQIVAIHDIATALRSADRVQCIRACGTGKSLIAAEVYPLLRPQSCVAFVPSIALIGQLIRDFRRQSPDLRFLTVCSDKSLAQKIRLGGDDEEDLFLDISGQVTQDPDVIRKFMRAGPGVVFSTYHSAPILQGIKFDLGLFDEAHRSTSEYFGFPVRDENVPIKKRAFFTATPRGEDGEGMSDPKLYGNVIHHLPFSRAIERELIVPYKIALIETEEKMGDAEDRLAWSCTGIARGISEGLFKRVIAYATTQKQARGLAETLNVNGVSAHFFHGGEKQAKRQTRLDALSRDPSTWVLTNAKCLTEGIDVPEVDAVCFVDPKYSVIDIVQATGRCMRRSPGKEHGVVMIPLFIPPGAELDSVTARSVFKETCKTLRSLIDSNDLLKIALANRLLVDAGHEDKAVGPSLETFFVKAPDWPEERYQLILTEISLAASANHKWIKQYRDYQYCLMRLNTEEAYRTGVGMVEPSHYIPDQKPRANWISQQRVFLKKGTLSPERYALLKLLPGWVDDPLVAMWYSKARAVETWIKNHSGEFPNSGSEDPIERALGIWIISQRKQFRDGILSAERVAFLRTIVDFLTDSVLLYKDDRWKLRLDNLRIFVEQHKRMPSTLSDDREEQLLAQWVMKQRRAIEGKGTGKMTPERRALLKTVPLWTDDPQDSAWWDKHARTLEYQTQEKELPPTYVKKATGRTLTSDVRHLGQWLDQQARYVRKGTISPERLAALKLIPGFMEYAMGVKPRVRQGKTQ